MILSHTSTQRKLTAVQADPAAINLHPGIIVIELTFLSRCLVGDWRSQALCAGRMSPAGFGVASLNDALRSRCGVSRLLSSSRSSSLSAKSSSSWSSSSSLPSSKSTSDGPGVDERDTDGDVGADTDFWTRPNTTCIAATINSLLYTAAGRHRRGRHRSWDRAPRSGALAFCTIKLKRGNILQGRISSSSSS